MGGDGGSIPKRDDLVRTKQPQQRAGRDAESAAKWKHCALSQQPLRRPIVACRLGRLYNKESVLEFLLDKKKFPVDVAPHIHGLRDVRELNLTASTSNGAGSSSNLLQSEFICPVSAVHMSGLHRFYFLWTCGCVFSEKAYKSVEASVPQCLLCSATFQPESDLILLNPSTEEDVKAAQDKLAAYLQQRGSSSKKAKKRPAEPTSSGNGESSKKKSDKKPSSEKQESSVQKDNSKSEVYKSLFTTHETAKKQPKAHWVTHNALYFH